MASPSRTTTQSTQKPPSRRVHIHEDPPFAREAKKWDEEGVAAPRYIPEWVLPQEDLDSLRAARAGAAPDIIYARGVPLDPTPDPDSFDRKNCSFVLFEIGFSRDLGLHDKRTQKTEKYYPLVCALRR